MILAAEGGFNPLQPEFGLFFWVTISFLVVFYILAKKVFPMLGETLSTREARIKAEIEEAENKRREAEQFMEEHKERLAQAREESNRIVDETRQSVEGLKKDLMAKAEAESRQAIDKVQNQIAGERERVVSEMQGQVATWVVEGVSHILSKELTPEAQRELVEQFISTMESEGAR
jgi:F-type H+-transporting ATPase subunit b